MVSAQVISEIRRHGVELRVEGDKLLFRSDRDVPSDLQTSIRTHKAELLQMLRQTESSDLTVGADVSKLLEAEAKFSCLDIAPLNVVLCVPDPDHPGYWLAYRRTNRKAQGRGDSQAAAVLELE